MKKLIKNLKISRIISLIIVVALIFTSAIGILGYLNMKKINNNMTKMYNDSLLPITSVTSIRADFLNIRVYVNKEISGYNKEDDTKIQDYKNRIEKRLAELTSVHTDTKESELINKFKNDYSQYINTYEKSKDLLEKGQKLPEEDLNTLNKVSENIENLLKESKDYELNVANELMNQSNTIYDKNLKLFVLLFLFSVIFLAIISIQIIKVLKSSTKEMLNILDEVAQGDFSVNIESNGKNEFEIMKKSLRRTLGIISQMINDIKDKSRVIDEASENLSSISEEMASSAENVSSTVQAMANGTSEQAEDLVSITSILNEFSTDLESVVKLIAEIDSNTKGIHSMAEKSNGDMGNVTISVQTVSNSFEDLISKISSVGQNVNRITEITNLINSISDQTNLLALNAAIEAARAGEAGRGFSIVADEIRSLAEQSKTSLDSINTLINTISKDASNMIETTNTVKNELSNQKVNIDTAIQSFTNITKAVDEVTPKIHLVNTSAEKITDKKNSILYKIEDATSIAEEVSSSAETIAASSEEMNASTEEVSQASQSLSDMVKETMNKVGEFKTA
ncbi:methyl-accepting chemotaxis protein [Clostridium sp. OS1-26]|uniref:methyl-accepting chemotaxis protein n=1 Tax=Clostridium sp. OS1-26 TaxID=3070681 RepID=UPI0027E0DEE3|nr:methyl-accepting chemotaxis protein [Clostridium sp. OS1-26]WML34873.1 methyl-accepting chemotaxis protein [Clostridium sp. OS1-26]